MNKIFASKFSVLLKTLVPVAEVFVKRRSVSGNLPDAGRAALCTAFFMVSTFAHATATNTTYQSYTIGAITYNLVDLSVVGLAQTNLNFLDTTPNMYFSNLSTGGVSTTCATGVTCVISTGNRNTNIPFEVTQAPNTAQIGGLFVNGGTAYVGGGAPASAPQAYTIQFSTPLAGQKSFYALTNTWWGNPSTTNEFNVTVNFTDGSSQVFQSLSGVDVRDFNYNPNTSQTISNTTKNWYLNGSQWIDVRSFSLAPLNYDKTVQGITITQMDRPYSAGIIAGLSLSPYALTPANDITVTYNNLYNMVRNSNGATIGRSATLYNYFDNVMVDVSSKFDGGTLTNSTSGSTLQHFTVTSGATVNNIRAGGYINAAANRLDFRGNFSNDSSVVSGTAGKMVIQNISNADINYDTHVGTPKSSVGTVVLSGDNSAFNGGFLVQAGANLEISEARNLGAGVLNLVGTATTAATLSTTRDILIANNITVNGDPVFNVAAGTTTTITGNIADGTTATSGSDLPGDVVVSGGGTLNLQGINTYTGPTEVVANSTMRLSGNGSLGGGHYAANIINAGSLQFASGATQEISGVISGSGDLAQMGPGVLTLSAANTYTGPTNVTGGTLDVTGSLASTAVTVAGGTLTDTNGGLATATNLTVNSGSANINADQTIANLNGSGGSVALASGKTLTVSNGGSYAGVVGGAGALTVSGGTETLSGANTYTGPTHVTGGTLDVTGSLASTVVTVSGGTLTDTNGGLATATNLTVNSGLANINADQSIANLNGSGGGLALASGKTLTITSGGTYDGVVSGAGALTVSGGTETLSGVNTYTGATSVTGGTLDVTGSLASTAVTVAGGTLTDTNGGLATATNLTVNSGSANINADQTIASLNGSGGSVSLASAKTLAVSSDGRYDGVLSGAGRFKVAGGTQTLSGSNTHSGGTEVAAGATLAIYSGDNLGTGMLDLVGTATTTATLQVLDNTTISNAVRVTADPTFNIAQGTTTTVNSVISDGASAGDVVVAGGGTLALTEVNTYSGRTTIDNGSTLTLSGNGQISSSQLVTNNGVFNMAPKTTNVTLAGNYTQSSTGGLSMSLTPVNNPQLLISGAASLAGSLSVAAAPGTYTAGRYNLINASNGVTGKFDRSSITGLSLAYLLGYDANYVYLTLLPVSVQSTAQSVQLNTNGLATMYNNQAAAYQAAMFYDCQVYDQNNLCISVGGRYTYAGPSPSSDAQAGVVIVGYRPSPKFRLGAFADQTVNISTPSGFTQSKTSPMWGFFAKWHMNNDETGLGVQAAAVTSASKMTVTRQKLQDSEPGSGSTQFDGQGFQLTSNYHQAITNDTSMVPYLGLRYTRINAGAYTENLSVNVEYPLSYNAMSQSTFSAVGGLGIRSHLAEKLTGTASVGIQQNLKYSMANYQGTSTIPGYENFSVAMPGNVNSMATASAGIYYDVKKNERFGFSLMWQQQPFINTNTTTALATYTIGF